MHIFTANSCKMVTDSSNITIAIRYEVAYIGFRIAYLDLTLPIVKVNVKVMHISTANWSQPGHTLLLPANVTSRVGVPLEYLELTLT